MELFQLVLIIMAAILISAVLEPLLPRVSLPLVQMLVGVCMYFFVQLPTDISIDSELFLAMFIAPLLFDESRNIDNRALFDNIKSVLSLAIGLVLVIVLCIGFLLHWIVPSISLAAAFALGAALGPTDAVAVASLGSQISLNKRQQAQLSGESLLNDASGVVSFQFALAAATTGAFSLAEASGTFAIEFFGGLGIGLLIGVIAVWLIRKIRRIGVESVTFHVCYELFLPFASYLIAQSLEVSGILAVVACGLVFSLGPKILKRNAVSFSTVHSRIDIASENVWGVISFILNGTIFTVLGYILPSTIEPAIEENSTDLFWLIGLVLVLSLAIEAIRFVWVFFTDWLSDKPETGGKRFAFGEDFLKNVLVTTLSGPKGAVSLSIMLTIPTKLASGHAFPQRDLLLFLTCGVILVTFLLASFVVPALSPKKDDSDSSNIDPDLETQMLENVISGLKNAADETNRRATFQVVSAYQARIANVKKKAASSHALRYLRQEVLVEQENYIKAAMQTDDVDRRLGETYLKRIDKMKETLMRSTKFNRSDDTKNRPLASSTTVMRRVARKASDRKNSKRTRIEFKIAIEQVAVDYLQQVSNAANPERADAAEALICEHQPLLNALKMQLKSLNRAESLDAGETADLQSTRFIRTDSGTLYKESDDEEDEEYEGLSDVQAEAFRLELEQIQSMNERGKISNSAAREMREEVYLLQMGLTE